MPTLPPDEDPMVSSLPMGNEYEYEELPEPEPEPYPMNEYEDDMNMHENNDQVAIVHHGDDSDSDDEDEEESEPESEDGNVVIKVDYGKGGQNDNVKEQAKEMLDVEAPIRGLDMDALRKRREELRQQQQKQQEQHKSLDVAAEDRDFEEVFFTTRSSSTSAPHGVIASHSTTATTTAATGMIRIFEVEEEEEVEESEFVPTCIPKFKTHMARKVFRTIENHRKERFDRAQQQRDAKKDTFARMYYVFSLERPQQKKDLTAKVEYEPVPVEGGLTINIKSAPTTGKLQQHPNRQQRQNKSKDSAVFDLPQVRYRSKSVAQPKDSFVDAKVPHNVMQQLCNVMQDFFTASKGRTRKHLKRKEKERKKREAKTIPPQQILQVTQGVPNLPMQPIDEDLDIFGDLDDESIGSHTTMTETKAKGIYFTSDSHSQDDKRAERAQNLLRDIQMREKREEKMSSTRATEQPDMSDKAKLRQQVADAKRKQEEIEAKFGQVSSSARRSLEKCKRSTSMNFGDEDFGMSVSGVEYEDFEYDSAEEDATLAQLIAEKKQDAQVMRDYAESMSKKEAKGKRSATKEKSNGAGAAAAGGVSEVARRAMKEGNEYAQIKNIMKRKFGTNLDDKSKVSTTERPSKRERR